MPFVTFLVPFVTLFTFLAECEYLKLPLLTEKQILEMIDLHEQADPDKFQNLLTTVTMNVTDENTP